MINGLLFSLCFVQHTPRVILSFKIRNKWIQWNGKNQNRHSVVLDVGIYSPFSFSNFCILFSTVHWKQFKIQSVVLFGTTIFLFLFAKSTRKLFECFILLRLTNIHWLKFLTCSLFILSLAVCVLTWNRSLLFSLWHRRAKFMPKALIMCSFSFLFFLLVKFDFCVCWFLFSIWMPLKEIWFIKWANFGFWILRNFQLMKPKKRKNDSQFYSKAELSAFLKILFGKSEIRKICIWGLQSIWDGRKTILYYVLDFFCWIWVDLHMFNNQTRPLLNQTKFKDSVKRMRQYSIKK